MSTIETIRAEIKRLIRINQTKNGFPAGTFCAIRIEAYEHLLAFLDSLQKQPASEDLEEEIARYLCEECSADDEPSTSDIARHFAEWGASHAVAPHYFELRELKTGRVFLAEWSDMAGEWYERGNGRAHQSDEVEIVQRDKKTPTPLASSPVLGEVHQALSTHYIAIDEKALCARLKEFPEGAKVDIYIEARKGEDQPPTP